MLQRASPTAGRARHRLADELGALPEQVTIGGTRYCHGVAGLGHELVPAGAGGRTTTCSPAPPSAGSSSATPTCSSAASRDDGIELVNPGSVGLPLDGDHRAAYALVLDDGSVALRRVSYDYEASAAAVVERFGDVPWAARSARRLREARP